MQIKTPPSFHIHTTNKNSDVIQCAYDVGNWRFSSGVSEIFGLNHFRRYMIMQTKPEDA